VLKLLSSLASEVVVRHPRPDDMDWIVQRHGAIYYEEQGWDERFEAIVASIVAEFMQHSDPKRERCFIAELDGERLGCVLLMRGSDEEAKLRVLLVEPHARGLGIGKRLVDECISFSVSAGYRRLSLWTSGDLQPARHIYETVGFRMIHEEPHDLFGEGLTGQTWVLGL
jgi:GNAT superfamily N-acetyltransferase